MEAVQGGVRSAPWVPAAVCGSAAATLLGVGLAGGMSGTLLLVTPISLALLGVILAVQRWLDQYKTRSSADAWIARGYDSPRSRYGWRVAELTSRRERRALARSLRRTVEEIEQPSRWAAIPLDVAALRPCRGLLEALADRLDDTSLPVSACGALAVERLLTDGATSPLYGTDDVRPFLIDLLDRLEVRR